MLNLSTLTNLELTEQLSALTGDERAVTVQILHYLNEIENRRLYRELGFTSLFDYCTRGLRYSESSACRRIKAARCLQDDPAIEALLLEGKVSLCTLTVAATALKSNAATLQDIAGCSRREVEAYVSKSLPVERKPRSVRRRR